MTIKEIADLFLASTGKIEFYWNFYTVTLLALFGWLVSTNAILRLELKVLITVGYLVFVLMNIFGLWSSYTFTEALRLDLLSTLKNDTAITLTNAQSVLGDWSFISQRTIMLIIHAVLGAFVLSAIWLGRFGKSESTPGIK